MSKGFYKQGCPLSGSSFEVSAYRAEQWAEFLKDLDELVYNIYFWMIVSFRRPAVLYF